MHSFMMGIVAYIPCDCNVSSHVHDGSSHNIYVPPCSWRRVVHHGSTVQSSDLRCLVGLDELVGGALGVPRVDGDAGTGDVGTMVGTVRATGG